MMDLAFVAYLLASSALIGGLALVSAWALGLDRLWVARWGKRLGAQTARAVQPQALPGEARRAA